jgi:hypothetical protein
MRKLLVPALLVLGVAGCGDGPQKESVETAESANTSFPLASIAGHYVRATDVPEPRQPWHELTLNADLTFTRLETFDSYDKGQPITAWVRGTFFASYNRNNNLPQMAMSAPGRNVNLGLGYLEIGQRDGKRTLKFAGQTLIEAQ